MRKKENGITLIVLVITVIVMLILAAVVLNMTLGDNGIIKKAGEAANKYEEAQTNELAMLNNLEDQYNNILNGNGNGGNEEEIIVMPEIEEVRASATTNSIMLEVIGNNIDTYRYSYKKATDEEFITVEQESNIYTLEGLEDSTQYIIKVEGMRGELKVEKEITVTTESMPSAIGAIEFSNLTWENKKARVSISSTSDYAIQYQVNTEVEEGWITANEASELNLNDTVYARLWDGRNGGESIHMLVTEITPPQVNIHIGQITTNSIAVNVEAIDNEAGMPDTPEYRYYIKKSTEANYPSTPNYTGGASHTFTGLTHNTEYDIKVTTQDLAENQGEITSQNNKTVQVTAGSGAITFSGITWASGKASISMSTTTSLTIQYQVNSTSGNWTSATTASNLNLNDTVYARLWDGTNGGDSVNTRITDTSAPNVAGIKLSATTANTGVGITATITQSDNQSGVKIGSCKWVYNTNSADIGTNAASYTGGTFTSTNQNISLTANAPGTYYLHVLTVDNAGNARESKSGAITIKQLVTSVGLNKTSTTLNTGATEKLTVTVGPSNASNKNINWSTSNATIATVSAGTITAKAPGTATITATAADGS